MNALVHFHYEILCPWKPHYPITTISKQLIYNYGVIIPWNYGELKNKMSFIKFVKFYCNCVLVPRWTLIEMNVHTIYMVWSIIFNFVNMLHESHTRQL
jgi:hypothetical protein